MVLEQEQKISKKKTKAKKGFSKFKLILQISVLKRKKSFNK